MSLDELADKLRSMWEAAPKGGKTPMVHLFGIRYADDLEDKDLRAIAELADVLAVWGQKFEKGVPWRSTSLRNSNRAVNHRSAHQLRRKAVSFVLRRMNLNVAQRPF